MPSPKYQVTVSHDWTVYELGIVSVRTEFARHEIVGPARQLVPLIVNCDELGFCGLVVGQVCDRSGAGLGTQKTRRPRARRPRELLIGPISVLSRVCAIRKPRNCRAG